MAGTNKSIFDFDFKFNLESPFDDWTDGIETIRELEEAKRNQIQFGLQTIVKGPGWEGSAWERVYELLAKNNKTYKSLISPYIINKEKTLTMQSTGNRGNSINATASTYMDFVKHEFVSLKAMTEFLGEKLARRKLKLIRVHLISDYYNNQVNSNLTDLGRAVNLIHEAIHINLHYELSDPKLLDIHFQHKHMGRLEIKTIQKALKEFNPKLTKEELLILSMSGLTHEKAYGNELLAFFAKTVLKKKIPAEIIHKKNSEMKEEEKELMDSVFQAFQLRLNKLIFKPNEEKE